MFSSLDKRKRMKHFSNKARLLLGISLLSCGLLLMFVPQVFHLQGHHTASHAIIVLGAIGVLLSFGVFGSKRKS